jgi:hypothetical protein
MIEKSNLRTRHKPFAKSLAQVENFQGLACKLPRRDAF